jgi:hypothetical protein
MLQALGPHALLVHDTLVVRDTIVRVALVQSSNSIGPRDIVGWAVTLVGIFVATAVAIIGWSLAAEHSTKVADKRRKLGLKHILVYEIPGLLRLFDRAGAMVRDRSDVAETIYAGIDATRAGFDRNSDSLVCFDDPVFTRSVTDWYRNALMMRVLIQEYILDSSQSPPPRPADELNEMKQIILVGIGELETDGKKILDYLGFVLAQGGHLFEKAKLPHDSLLLAPDFK